MKTTLNFRPRDYVLHSNFPKGPLKHFHTIKIERKTRGVLERSLLLPTQKSSLDLSKPLLCPPPAPRGVKDQVPGLREELPLCTSLGSRTRPSASWTIRRLDHFLWGRLPLSEVGVATGGPLARPRPACRQADQKRKQWAFKTPGPDGFLSTWSSPLVPRHRRCPRQDTWVRHDR